jgi:hypothetical protein
MNVIHKNIFILHGAQTGNRFQQDIISFSYLKEKTVSKVGDFHEKNL